jgi:hypothetical protein
MDFNHHLHNSSQVIRVAIVENRIFRSLAVHFLGDHSSANRFLQISAVASYKDLSRRVLLVGSPKTLADVVKVSVDETLKVISPLRPNTAF